MKIIERKRTQRWGNNLKDRSKNNILVKRELRKRKSVKIRRMKKERKEG